MSKEHSCTEELQDKMNWDDCNTVVVCPVCNKEYEVLWDEVWDGEEEWGWFYLDESD